jgi:GTP-binding protein Era
VDIVLFMIEKLHWLPEDELVAQRLASINRPVVLVINKVDTLDDKEMLLPHMQKMIELLDVKEIIPISALQNQNLDRLEDIIRGCLPESEHFFPEDQITDRSSRFLAAEIIREKITRQLGDELPYQMTVEIEEFSQEGKILHINALILVERDGQKRILIGDKGDRLKKIGQQAREDMQLLFDSKIMLKTWVKVKSGWSDDERALRSLGYDDR